MLFVFHLLDKKTPDTPALRARLRPEHKQYLAGVGDRIAFAGPLLGGGGPEDFVGSLLVIDFDSEADALAWLENEPFTRAGVYGERSIHAFVNTWPQRAGFVAG
ncbi:YciI family protein [Pigmentiphaga sp.]|uniref:YciI family protein n=1 Tax=Pigmentiphaga sp. TaxID=1977564 RepID=UPI0025E8936C|nr:YciI family protein [Pigmentiphaga sp.]MBX6319014.1 YciI family protein [Pigmentiphaga sp.]